MPPVKPGKGVTISGLKYRGISYIIEFVSDKVGRAYFITNEGTKGDYAGKFTLSPVQLLPDITESNVRDNNAPKPASAQKKKTPNAAKPTPASPKPTPASPKPTPAPVKPTPAAPKPTPAAPKPTPAAPKPTPAATKAAAGFFEKQEGLGCGRHALNNLLGERLFVKGTQEEGFKFPPPVPPYSLLGICSMVSERLRDHGIPDACLKSENYDVNTMFAALDYLGYSSEQINPLSAIPENGDYLGLLLNLGVVQGKPQHWVALKFKSRAANGTVTYTLYDSLHAAPSETTLATYLKRHPNVYTIKVMLPKGQPTHPYERIDILPYPEGMKPGGTPPIYGKTAAAKQTSWIQRVGNKGFPVWENPVTGEIQLVPPTLEDSGPCTEFFDPCTKESLGSDPAVLEARIKEILTKKGGTRRLSRQGKRKTRTHY